MCVCMHVAPQVYSSQMQLGGPRVMGENGVSHYVVNDDLEGMKVILRWLSYCPPQLGAEPPLLPTNDPVDRPVAYQPTAHEKFDPRAAIMGEYCAKRECCLFGQAACLVCMTVGEKQCVPAICKLPRWWNPAGCLTDVCACRP